MPAAPLQVRSRQADVCGPVGLVCGVLAFGLVVAPVGSALLSIPLAVVGLVLGTAGIVQTFAGDSRGRAVAIAAVVVSTAVPLYVMAVVLAFVLSIGEGGV
jgi:hypothetical protein